MLQHDRLPSAIIWDLDGTLVESATDLATALNALLNEQGHLGHPVDCVRSMIGNGVGKLIERGFSAADAPLTESECDALIPRFVEIYSECCTRNTALKPHARDVLLYFYNAGVPQGLCTNKLRVLTDQILIAIDVTGFFTSIVGGDSTPEKKPSALPLLTCLGRLGAAPEQSIMIGDSGTDVDAARAAGVPVILVADGYTSVPAGSLGADEVVGSLADIPSFFPHYVPLLHSA